MFVFRCTHLDIFGMLALGYAHHPEKLVDVVTAVADDATEYHKHVVDVERAHDLVGGALVRRHRFAHLSLATSVMNCECTMKVHTYTVANAFY